MFVLGLSVLILVLGLYMVLALKFLSIIFHDLSWSNIILSYLYNGTTFITNHNRLLLMLFINHHINNYEFFIINKITIFIIDQL